MIRTIINDDPNTPHPWSALSDQTSQHCGDQWETERFSHSQMQPAITHHMRARPLQWSRFLPSPVLPPSPGWPDPTWEWGSRHDEGPVCARPGPSVRPAQSPLGILTLAQISSSQSREDRGERCLENTQSDTESDNSWTPPVEEWDSLKHLQDIFFITSSFTQIEQLID